MSTTLERYNSSGKFGPLTAVYAVGGAVALGLLAWVYQLALTWIPFIYIEFILVGGFGFAAGLAVSMIMDMGHCRNRGVGALVGLLLGAVGLAASFWWGYRSGLSSVIESNPQVAAEEIAAQYSFGLWIDDRVEGGWTIKSAALNGAFVWVMWSLEALIVLGISGAMGWIRAGHSYCEKCKAWHTSQTGETMGSQGDRHPAVVGPG